MTFLKFADAVRLNKRAKRMIFFILLRNHNWRVFTKRICTSYDLSMKKYTVLLGLIVSLAVSADSFSDKCPDIASCAKVVSGLTGQKYLYELGEVKGKVSATSNLELTKENAEVLFTQMLFLNGFSRVQVAGQKETYTIQKIKEAKSSNLTVLETNQKFPPNFGLTYDLMMMKYKMTNSESMKAVVEFVSPNLRTDCTINGNELTGVIHVTSSAQDLRAIYQTIREMDQKPSNLLKRK